MVWNGKSNSYLARWCLTYMYDELTRVAEGAPQLVSVVYTPFVNKASLEKKEVRKREGYGEEIP